MYPLVILAGGMATRLGNIAKDKPKCLVSVAGKPFINWQLEYARNQGISNVFICSGWLGNKVNNHVNSLNYQNLNIKVISDGNKLLGTGGAINNILSMLPDNFFVLYGDTYLPIDFKKVQDYYDANIDPNNNLMTVYKNNSELDKSNIIYKNGVIIKYNKKDFDMNMQYIDYGLGIMSKKSFSLYGEKDYFDLSDMYEYLVNNKILHPYLVTERFYEIGTPESLAESEKYFKGF